MSYEPNVKQLAGYFAFIDFATSDEAIRATMELDARQDAGDCLRTRKSKYSLEHIRKIQLLIQGETIKQRKKRRRGTANQQGQKDHPRKEDTKTISQPKLPRKEELIVISDPEPEEEIRHHKEDQHQSVHQKEGQLDKASTMSSFIRISDLPFETTEADIRDFLGPIKTYVPCDLSHLLQRSRTDTNSQHLHHPPNFRLNLLPNRLRNHRVTHRIPSARGPTQPAQENPPRRTCHR